MRRRQAANPMLFLNWSLLRRQKEKISSLAPVDQTCQRRCTQFAPFRDWDQAFERSIHLKQKRGRQPKEINFEAESLQREARLTEMVGQQVPLSCFYTKGERPTLVSIDDGKAVLRYRNGVEICGVPLSDLMDDAGYWK